MKLKKFFGLSIDPKVLRLSFDPTMQWFSGFTIIVVEMRARIKGQMNGIDGVGIGMRPGEPVCKVLVLFSRAFCRCFFMGFTACGSRGRGSRINSSIRTFAI